MFINLCFKKHQSECLFKVVKCSNSGCAKMLSKQDMKTHETLQCSWRKVNCEYCQESVIMNQKQVWNRFIQYIFTILNYVLYEPAQCPAVSISNHLPFHKLFQTLAIIRHSLSLVSVFSHRSCRCRYRRCLVPLRVRHCSREIWKLRSRSKKASVDLFYRYGGHFKFYCFQ